MREGKEANKGYVVEEAQTYQRNFERKHEHLAILPEGNGIFTCQLLSYWLKPTPGGYKLPLESTMEGIDKSPDALFQVFETGCFLGWCS